MAIAIVPTIQKLDHSKSGHFCPDFNWFLTKWWPFVQILYFLGKFPHANLYAGGTAAFELPHAV